MTENAMDTLRDWIGKCETRHDIVHGSALEGLAATLDSPVYAPAAGRALPLPWHWLHFLPNAPTASLGQDGHPRTGGFLPPVPLPRRMWAGSRITAAQLQPDVGTAVSRTSTITSIDVKQGKSGPLVFVKLRHEVSSDLGMCITEEQDIVYRDDSPSPNPLPAGKAARTDAWWSREVVGTPALLFRFSALTFNAHRIHYDRPYTQEVEGYPGLVVHGPLIATLLLDLAYRASPGMVVKAFEFRAVRPLFDGAPFLLCAAPQKDTPSRIDLWTRDADGYVTTEASLEFSH